MVNQAEMEAQLIVNRRANERRQRQDRRDDVTDAEFAGDERRKTPRRKVERRRQIDPTTCERDYSDDEIDFMKAMYGGADIEEYAPIRVGDVLDVRPVVSSVVTKDGRNGPLTFVELTTDYITEDGTLAMRERSTTIQKG